MKDFSKYNLYSEYPNAQVAEEERTEYVAGIKAYIASLRKSSKEKREKYMNPDSYFANPEKFRREYREMLGVPLSEYHEGMPKPNVRKKYVATDGMCEIYRMQIEATENLWFYGIYFVPNSKKNEKTGLVICQHGGGGTPELCSDMHGKNNYNHMVRRVIDRGLRVFAPQLLLWGKAPGGDVEPLPVLSGAERHTLDSSLKQLGGSIQALETFCIMRSLDLLCDEPLVDETKIGMIGCSYGGFYTLMTAAADTRIVSAYSSCAMNDRFKFGWADWVWKNSGNTFLDTEIAALAAPRRFYGEVGKEDAVFTVDSVPDFNSAVKPFYAKFGKGDNFRFNIHGGGHSVDTDDGGFDFFIEPLV